ncbi:MAG: tetratricopeptide repeat protein, partial [Anaerolineales bacterium]|nr:tetratricopeptide repeat protein [Anaerolineales bacterium]
MQSHLMPDTLLATKLHIPRLRLNLVHRPRLMERLDSALRRKLTLVSAPAGYGKTTTLTAWIDRSQIPTAWLSLDEGDNDLARFLIYIIAALQRVFEGIGLDVQAALSESPLPPVETLLTRLVNEIAGDGRQFTLVLDDYHLISSETVHAALNFLLDHQPPNMHLVITGRADPPLPISRLRVRGELTEVRTPELRFTKDEVAAFLNDLMGFDLSTKEIAALETRTEGWIASLQLAALSMQGQGDRGAFVAAFSGSHRYVIDYLIDEVMSRQPEDLQAFLCQTSILDRFCAPLCDAALKITSSRQILGKLEGANLFLIPLDDERHWYRYHHLFADFLGQRLCEAEPEHIPELHRRASQWYEAQGVVDEAIQHALAAGDLKNATRLVDQIAADLVVRRESNKLLKLMDQLPPDRCQDYPMLCIWHAWALLFLGQLEAVEPVLQIAEANQGKAPGTPIPGYLTIVRAYLANQMGYLVKAIALTEKALEQMSHAPPDRITLIFRGAAIIWLGVNHRFLGNLDQARQLFSEAASLNQKAGNIYAALASLEQSADLAVISGQLHQAVEIYRRGLQMARRWADEGGEGRGALVAASGLHLGLGTVLYQWNDLAGAAPHIRRAVELDELGEVWGRMHAYRMLAYLKQAEGDYKTSNNLLGKACAIRDKITVSQANITALPNLEKLGIILSRTHPDMAYLLTDVARRVETQGLQPDDEVDFSSPAGYRHESKYSALARVLIAQGRADEALPLLERLLEASRSMGRQGDEIRYLILKAMAYHALEDKISAVDSLSQALTLAKPEGYVRIFVDEGAPMATLLAQAVSQEIAPDYAGELLAAFPEDVRGAVIFDVEQTSIAQPLVERLSERELEVLRL